MPKHILVIDDDHLVAKSLSKLLEKEGYNIICTENSHNALVLLSDTDFDLIITDIKMPGMDGIKMATIIKDTLKLNKKKDIPIIFITGYSDEKSYADAKKLNVADFIYKPFDKEKFLQSVENTLKN